MSSPKTDRIQVRIDPEQREQLELLRDGACVGPIVREALELYFKRPTVAAKIAANSMRK